MSQIIEARFTCNSITPNTSGNSSQVNFSAVYDNNGANASFSKATPYGSIVMGIDKETDAATAFQRGKTYKVTFEEVEAGQ